MVHDRQHSLRPDTVWSPAGEYIFDFMKYQWTNIKQNQLEIHQKMDLLSLSAHMQKIQISFFSALK